MLTLVRSFSLAIFHALFEEFVNAVEIFVDSRQVEEQNTPQNLLLQGPRGEFSRVLAHKFEK